LLLPFGAAFFEAPSAYESNSSGYPIYHAKAYFHDDSEEKLQLYQNTPKVMVATIIIKLGIS